MTADIIDYPGITTLDLDPDKVLEAAKGECSKLMIIGFDHDGDEYFAGTISDGPTALWLIERLRYRLLKDDE